MMTTKKSVLTNSKKEVYRKLSAALGRRLRSDVILAPYTTFGIGGKADYFYRAVEPEDLLYAVRTAQKLKLPFFILGGGSNVLISDSGFKGLVIKNECREVWVNHHTVSCQSGAVLDLVVKKVLNSSLSGLEFAIGIPGTVGGAVRGNAGAFGKAVGDLLIKAVVLNRHNQIKEVEKDFFGFGYRHSILKQNGGIVLSATFRLKKRDKRRIKKQMVDYRKSRNANLPWKEHSAGCFFKNIVRGEKKISAGYLLDQIGAKGMRVGDAQVSVKHANFLINRKKAKSEDVENLSSKLKQMIRGEFNINLEEEVVYIK
jgi:UDP-N-acetylmuramate dehydrogenase